VDHERVSNQGKENRNFWEHKESNQQTKQKWEREKAKRNGSV